MIKTYGEKQKGKHPSEAAEMITFFSVLRREYPEYGAIAIHIRNEGKRSYSQAAKEKLEGMVKGASDIIIPGNPSFVCELKTLSKSSQPNKDQLQYLENCIKIGSFACIANGYKAALEAFKEWLDLQKN